MDEVGGRDNQPPPPQPIPLARSQILDFLEKRTRLSSDLVELLISMEIKLRYFLQGFLEGPFLWKFREVPLGNGYFILLTGETKTQITLNDPSFFPLFKSGL